MVIRLIPHRWTHDSHILKLFDFTAFTFFKAHIVVNVHHLSSGHVNQNVVEVTVAKADDVPHHGHDSSGSGIRLQSNTKRLINEQQQQGED